MRTIQIGTRTFQLKPSDLVGSGGEAEIYDLGNGKVFKFYKPPIHADFKGDAVDQLGAKLRIKEHQKKLPAFMQLHMPTRVIGPSALGKQKSGIVGYAMKYIKFTEPLMRFGDRSFRERQCTHTDDDVQQIIQDLHKTVQDLHLAGIVIGDFNDLNVLVDNSITVVDADSMQFGGFTCKLFTERFVDPVLCKPDALILARPHNENSDWYAFAIMLLQLNLFVHPYGGIHRPLRPKNRAIGVQRQLQRISVFHKEVRFPKVARSLDCLPTDLAHHLSHVFEQDLRAEFPLKLLDVHWTSCSSCGYTHARSSCPNCKTAHPSVKKTVEVRGTVTATTVFFTKGVIIHASAECSGLKWLYREGNNIKRETGTKIPFSPNPILKFGIIGDETYIGRRNNLFLHSGTSTEVQTQVDQYKDMSCFATNSTDLYFLHSGTLYQKSKQDLVPDRVIGDVLIRQTQIWVGNTFGFGFYQAGELSNAFTFHTQKGSFLDIALPHIAGQIISAKCKFADLLAYFQVTVQQRGKLLHHLFIISDKGVLLNHLTDDEPGTWIRQVPQGAMLGPKLFLPTDEGLIRVDMDERSFKPTIARTYPDTDPWVDSNSHIIIAKDGVYTINNSSITKLSI